MKGLKGKIHNKVLQELKDQLDTALLAAKRAHENATHEENKAENKYDTLGLEEAYLAEGQSQRVQACEHDLQTFSTLKPREFSSNDAITAGALVELIDENGQQRVFISPVGGGTKIFVSGERVDVVSAHSPLGEALRGKFVGDEVSVSTGKGIRFLEILGII